MSVDPKQSLIELLTQLGQDSLVARVKAQAPTDAQCSALLSQINNLANFYSGGVTAYMQKAKQLVTDFKEAHQEIPTFMGLPDNITKIELGAAYEALEEHGAAHVSEVGVVLVAGGLGERLGSKQIKISIECDIITGTTFMELYLAYLRAFAKLSGKKMRLFIMTSDDTHVKTIEFLKNFDYSSYLDLHIEKQDKVPAMTDLAASLDISEDWVMQTKPHGHGDVHFLVKQSGILDKWTQEGIKHVYFIQDTNPFSLASLPVILGHHLKEGSLFTFTGVTRKPQEPVGALVQDEKGFTYNVEYNVFDSHFKLNKKEEMLTASGHSVYPGNINVFLIDANEYKTILSAISSMKEFINIKFDKADPKKIASSWRVECLMQDIAFSISDPKRIGVALFERSLAFTTCKNNLVTGRIASSKGLPSETIVQCENDIYLRNFILLQYCGLKFTSKNLSQSLENIEESDRCLEQIKLPPVPRIFLHPSFGVTVKDIKEAVKGLTIDGNGDAALVLKGKISLTNCFLSNVSLWIDNCDNEKRFRFENFRLVGRPEDVLRFTPLEEGERKDGDLRGYKVDDFCKVTKIINF